MIPFRIWIPEIKKMIYSKLNEDRFRFGHVVEIPFRGDLDECIFMQSIPIRDKEDRLVFVGDLVEFGHGESGEIEEFPWGFSVVNPDFSIKVRESDFFVIGNKFEGMSR